MCGMVDGSPKKIGEYSLSREVKRREELANVGEYSIA
jgi:hypothetical protein